MMKMKRRIEREFFSFDLELLRRKSVSLTFLVGACLISMSLGDMDEEGWEAVAAEAAEVDAERFVSTLPFFVPFF